MRTRTRRKLGWQAAAALAVTLGAPSLARAQQGGLFPLAPIRRERVPCAAEDPVYRLYRQEYFGYHPTCWRKFPNGWGCPSPEAPNAAAEFQKLPRDKPPGDPNGEPGNDNPDNAPPGNNPPGDAMPGAGGEKPNPGALPPLPSGERSPFDLDTKPSTPPAGRARSPFETDPKPGTPPAGTGAAPGAAGLPSVPEVVPAPADTPRTDNLTPPAPPGAGPSGPSVDAAEDKGTEHAAAVDPTTPDDKPLLALPDPTVGPSSPSSTPPGNPGLGGESPVRAPRRSFISRLFNGQVFRR